MPKKVWVYNYDFEFELSNKPIEFTGNKKKLPWWFLNRSSSVLIPFTKPGDLIISYQIQEEVLLEHLSNRVGFLPDFFVLPPDIQESNSILTDLQSIQHLVSDLNSFELAPWGWSPKAIYLANHLDKQQIPRKDTDIIFSVNSKKFSDHLRSGLLPRIHQIKSKQIDKNDLNEKSLSDLLNQFLLKHCPILIKHYFGASGRLSDKLEKNEIPKEKISKWSTWIEDAGGLLLEEWLSVKSEFSIQAEISGTDDIKVITQLEMLSNKSGSYLGNIIDSNKADYSIDPGLILPLLKRIAKVGYNGPLGIDFLRTNTNEIKLVEINARLTMGRVAFEWNRLCNPKNTGLFFNAILARRTFSTANELVLFCHKLEKDFDCSITIINCIQSPDQPYSLITILVGAKTKKQVFTVASELNSVFKQYISS